MRELREAIRRLHKNGKSDAEILAECSFLFDYGRSFIAAHIDLELHPSRAAPPRRVTVSTPIRPTPTTHNLTEMGNAERLVERDGNDLRFINGKWYVWDGTRFREDDTGEIDRRAKDTVRTIYDEAAAQTDPDRRKALAEHAKRSESASQIRAMIKLAESDPSVARRVDDMDRDDFLLTVLNGTVDLRTGELRTHRREDEITKLAPIRVSASATCPLWDAAILAIMDGREEMVRYLYRQLGSALTASTRDQVLFVWWGAGGNGKSTVLRMARAIWGDYAGTVRTDALMERSGGGHNEDVARLRGLRLVFAVETAEGKRLNVALVKTLTGGDALSASFKHGHVFEFQPKFKPILATNHLPKIPGGGEAMWRRIKLHPFTVRFAGPDENAEGIALARDDTLEDRIRAEEIPGIFNRILAGCIEWQRIGLDPPKEAQQATAEYRREESPERRFIEETFTRDPAGKVLSKDLLSKYAAWCAENDEVALTPKALHAKLRALGLESGKTHGDRIWKGVRDPTQTEIVDGWRVAHGGASEAISPTRESIAGKMVENAPQSATRPPNADEGGAEAAK